LTRQLTADAHGSEMSVYRLRVLEHVYSALIAEIGKTVACAAEEEQQRQCDSLLLLRQVLIEAERKVACCARIVVCTFPNNRIDEYSNICFA
jgi:hypothetical protein